MKGYYMYMCRFFGTFISLLASSTGGIEDISPKLTFERFPFVTYIYIASVDRGKIISKRSKCSTRSIHCTAKLPSIYK